MVRAGDVIHNPVTGHRYRIRLTGADTDGALLEMDADFPAGVPVPPEHVHPSQEERFEILDGTLEVRIAGTLRHVTRGDMLVIPPGTPHAMWTQPSRDARVRWETRPALRTADFFAAAARLAAAGRVKPNGAPGLLDAGLLLHTYRAEMRLSKPAPGLQRIVFGLLAGVARVAGRRL